MGNNITLEMVEEIIKDITSKITEKPRPFIAILGTGAKEAYVNYCKSLGWSDAFINSTLTDNGDGTFTFKH